MPQSDDLDQARLDVVEAAHKCLPGSGRVHSEGPVAAFGHTFQDGFAVVPLGAWLGLLDALLEERRATATYFHDSGAPHETTHCGRCHAKKKETDK